MTPPSEKELLPCPLCCAQVKIYGDKENIDFQYYKISCDVCLLEIESYGSNKNELIERWNTRTERRKVVAEILERIESNDTDYIERSYVPLKDLRKILTEVEGK